MFGKKKTQNDNINTAEETAVEAAVEVAVHEAPAAEASENAEPPIITKETLIGELLRIDDGVGYILMGIGMHCFGCPASQMESIEEAAMVHGVNADALVDEINEYIKVHAKVRAEEAAAPA